MSKFHKKPVVVEAVQWYGKYTDGTEWPDWFRDAWDSYELHFYLGGTRIAVETTEGQMVGEIGDWVIQGIKGELYPCKADVFAASYEQE
jgi:hypothetical protein